MKKINKPLNFCACMVITSTQLLRACEDRLPMIPCPYHALISTFNIDILQKKSSYSAQSGCRCQPRLITAKGSPSSTASGLCCSEKIASKKNRLISEKSQPKRHIWTCCAAIHLSGTKKTRSIKVGQCFAEMVSGHVCPRRFL